LIGSSLNTTTDFPPETQRDNNIAAPRIEYDAFYAANCDGDTAIFGRAPAGSIVEIASRSVLVRTLNTPDEDGMAPFCLRMRLDIEETNSNGDDVINKPTATNIFLATRDEISGKYSMSTPVKLYPRLDCDSTGTTTPDTEVLEDINIVLEASSSLVSGELINANNMSDGDIATSATLTLNNDGNAIILLDFDADGDPAWDISKIEVRGVGILNVQAAYTALPASEHDTENTSLFDTGWRNIRQSTSSSHHQPSTQTENMKNEPNTPQENAIDSITVTSARGMFGPVRRLALRINGSEESMPAISTWLDQDNDLSEYQILVKDIAIWARRATKLLPDSAQHGQSLCP